MDTQTIINVAMTLAGFFGGWTLKRITDSLDRLDSDLRRIPDKYLAKEDYRRDIDDIKEMLERIFNKLDTKVDK